MTPTRRKLITTGSIAGVLSLAGCMDSIIADTDDYPNEDENTTDSDDEQNEPTDDEESDEPEIDSDHPIPSRILDLTGYLTWLDSEYDSAREQYLNDLRDVSDALIDLREKETGEIELDTIDQIATDLTDLRLTADELFGDYYDDHYPFHILANELEDDVRPSLRREEYTSAEDDISRISRQVYVQRESGRIYRRYPRHIVYQEPYAFFTDQDDREDVHTDRIFETHYVSGDTTVSLFATPQDMNLRQAPFGIEQDTDRYQTPVSFTDRETDIFDLTEWLTDENATSELYVNVMAYELNSMSYPDDYLPDDGGFGSEETDVDDLEHPNFNEAASVPVYIQIFETEQDATEAIDSIRDTAEVDDESTHRNEVYDQVFNTGVFEDRTVYADVTQVGNMVVALDMADRQWPDREDPDQLDDDNDRVDTILEDTFLEGEPSD